MDEALARASEVNCTECYYLFSTVGVGTFFHVWGTIGAGGHVKAGLEDSWDGVFLTELTCLPCLHAPIVFLKLLYCRFGAGLSHFGRLLAQRFLGNFSERPERMVLISWTFFLYNFFLWLICYLFSISSIFLCIASLVRGTPDFIHLTKDPPNFNLR